VGTAAVVAAVGTAAALLAASVGGAAFASNGDKNGADTTLSSDAPAASRRTSMLRNVCAVCSAMSSLIILPVVGSKPPWPERKIHSPTERPGEYGPTVVGAYSELIKVFMGEPP